MSRAARSKAHRAASTSRAALLLATLALILTFTGVGEAARQRVVNVVDKPKPRAVLRLDAKGRFPARALPVPALARDAERLGGQEPSAYVGRCNALAVDLGTWCLHASPFAVPNEDAGRNNWFYATQKCAEEGGYLPTAAQLIGAADRVKLASTIDDDRTTASIDEDPSDGLKDRREMSATLITTQAGSSAAGSQGVSDGSRGDPRAGEPDPTPQPANPAPETLQYVTVYDNQDKGGFAGARPVSQADQFRCAFDKAQGDDASEEG
jgi:hypothetical protein